MTWSPATFVLLQQLAARGTKERARLGWPFLSGKNYLEKYDVS
jgi:hypothetical protein